MKNNILHNEFIRIIKYIFSSGSSFLLDLILFTLFEFIFKDISIHIILSTILARIFSSLYNYLFNSRFVFKKYNKKTIIGYYLLTMV